MSIRTGSDLGWYTDHAGTLTIADHKAFQLAEDG